MNKKDKVQKREQNKKPKIDTFPKLMLFIIIVHGMMCVTASYVLAFINHITVVENLSITIVGQIVAPFICYALGSVVSNVFEKNQLTFSTPLTAIESGMVTPINATTTTVITNEKDTIGTIDNPIDLNTIDNDELLSFEFGSASGKGED